MIVKEAAAQGLSHETYINLQDNNATRQPQSKVAQSILKMPTSIRFCKVPPCNDSNKSNYHLVPMCGPKKTSTNNATTETTFKPCDCSPEKLTKLFEKSAKELSSKACNVTSIEIIDAKKLLSDEQPVLKCNCMSKKSPEAVTSHEKKQKNECPCTQNISIENDFEDKMDIKKITSAKDRCKCVQFEEDQKHIKKNIICECPEPEPEPEIDYWDYYDEKEERRLKSDLTQTVSGFRINIPRKKTDREFDDFEMSFEETLRYIAENLESESSRRKLQSKNVSVNCECPYEPYIPEALEENTVEEEPFMGIKFHITGKGSGSKGLNGILCFQLLNNIPKEIGIKEYTK
ncbi:uncharacterized protein LOC124543339 [Vanessa cardui]|uniref:uncharacterized protein LOC124543339 n=1 Tax=Vanessa cardui TaxID=171605 RepID=UPI001F13A97E|nr:uncharacterized protein LOC124543339 [Vanessa cardui]